MRSIIFPPKVRHAFEVMGLGAEQVADVFMVLSGILHLGNVSFVSAAGAQIAEKAGTWPVQRY